MRIAAVSLLVLIGIAPCALAQNEHSVPAAIHERASAKGRTAAAEPSTPSRMFALAAPRTVSLEGLPEGARLALLNGAVAMHREVPGDLMEQGEWTALPDGRRLWRVAIHSPEARSIRVHFSGFDVEGGQVWLGSESAAGAAIANKPFAAQGPLGDGEFWSTSVFADTVWVEFVPAADQTSDAIPFTIDRISHYFDAPHAASGQQAQAAKSGANKASPNQVAPCQLESKCYPEYADVASGVAQLHYERSGFGKPDVVVTVGDRFETMATAVASAYMNIPLAHTMGGEVTGTIDESIRHAITKLAHIHFPANRDAADRIVRLGEDPDTVHVVGCPRIDLVAEVVGNGSAALDAEWLEREGVGGHITTDEPFLLVSQHPVTTEYGQAEHQITETLMALHDLQMPTVMLWPNVDAGSEDISRGMRKFREKYKPEYIRFYKNFPVETYLRLMQGAACLVGNSSASLREGAFIGTPAVNIGTRQDGRERGPNVIDVGHDRTAIAEAVRRQLARGSYTPAYLYGDGRAGERIADVLSRAALHVQKRIQY